MNKIIKIIVLATATLVTSLTYASHIPDKSHISVIVSDSKHANELWIGTEANGLFRSTGNENNSIHINENNLIGITSIAINPNNANDVYVGTKNHGLFISKDHGNTWNQIVAGNTYISDVQIDSNNTIYYLDSTKNAMYQSSDDGMHWDKLSKNANLNSHMLSFTINPNQPNHILIGTTHGIIRSIDGGTSWLSLANTNIENDIDKIFYTDKNELYAFTSKDVFYFDIYKSTDDGNTWQSVTMNKPNEILTIGAVSLQSPRNIYITNWYNENEKPTLIKSGDYGKTWQSVMSPIEYSDEHLTIPLLTTDANDSNVIYFADTNNVYRFENNVWLKIFSNN